MLMEEPCRTFDTKPSTTALESEPVSETDVSQGVRARCGLRVVSTYRLATVGYLTSHIYYGH